ncbi:hypothetical protein LXL04_014868 [Taraxacum kok-saghyz]
MASPQDSKPTGEQNPGIFGNIMQTVTGTIGGAKDAVMGKAPEKVPVVKDTPMGKAVEYKDYTVEKAIRAKDFTVNSAIGAKDFTVEKAIGAKDFTVNSAIGAKDFTVEKTIGAKDFTINSAIGAKDFTVEKAIGARDFTVEKAIGAKDFTVEKTIGAKDFTVNNAIGAKDFTVEKATQAKDFTMGSGKDTSAEDSWGRGCCPPKVLGLKSRSFENSYIPENPRTPKPLTFSKNRLRGAKNRSNISPVAKKNFRKNDFFFQKLCICANFFLCAYVHSFLFCFKTAQKHEIVLNFFYRSLYNTYLKRFVKKNLKKNAKKKSCTYAQKIKKSCTYAKVKKKYRFFGNFFQRIVMIKNVLEGSEVGFLKGITMVKFKVEMTKSQILSGVSSIAQLCTSLEETKKSETYHLLSRLIRLLLTLPVSTATTERGFSAMKLCKSRLRNKMADDFLADILKKKFDSESVIEEFKNIRGRRAEYQLGTLSIVSGEVGLIDNYLCTLCYTVSHRAMPWPNFINKKKLQERKGKAPPKT